jgi:hypothetical protein
MIHAPKKPSMQLESNNAVIKVILWKNDVEGSEGHQRIDRCLDWQMALFDDD